ncbi:hypothetical protein B5F40_07700 [Gordonibacter sp. An230]|uniref:hypothetical protein n=1 Tax=Gordonibacter sp. An230 TaxID=1965592 RepID=UPI000B37C76A|nr:hypothetical protein [Gordonibacter sp. An230]OUO90330.1 hypothetical protein B5F40_07700 [Gordonibacter sp. An230]
MESFKRIFELATAMDVIALIIALILAGIMLWAIISSTLSLMRIAGSLEDIAEKHGKSSDLIEKEKK